MKKLRFIIGSLVLLTTSIIIANSLGYPVTYYRVMSYDKCNKKYPQYLFGRKFLFEGHYITNEMQKQMARKKLILCLFNVYEKNNADSIRVKIKELAIKVNPEYHVFQFDTLKKSKEMFFNPTIYIE